MSYPILILVFLFGDWYRVGIIPYREKL